jgi:hypothetical protein
MLSTGQVKPSQAEEKKLLSIEPKSILLRRSLSVHNHILPRRD